MQCIMKFNREERGAIYKIGHEIMTEDGIFFSPVFIVTLMALGLKQEEIKQYSEEMKMGYDKAASAAVISGLDSVRKKCVAALFGTMLWSGGGGDAVRLKGDKKPGIFGVKEQLIWQHVSKTCGLPTMKIEDALNYIRNVEFRWE